MSAAGGRVRAALVLLVLVSLSLGVASQATGERARAHPMQLAVLAERIAKLHAQVVKATGLNVPKSMATLLCLDKGWSQRR